MSNIGNNLRHLRKENHMTQDQLAEQVHVTRQAISNWENGRNEPDIDAMEALAEVFHTDLQELIYGVKKSAPYERYQKKYTAGILICLAMILAAVLFLEAELPVLERIWLMHYKNIMEYYGLKMLCGTVISLAAGYGVCAVFSLWYEIRTPYAEMCRTGCWIAILPMLFVLLSYVLWKASGSTVFSAPLAWILRHGIMQILFMDLCPLLAGILFFLYRNEK